jgi:hypothetical protein
MDSRATVSVTAIFAFPGETDMRRATVDEYVRVRPLLNAPTLRDAMTFFLAQTDVVLAADGIESFKINGHEILNTFIDAQHVLHGELPRQRLDPAGMARLRDKARDILMEARAQLANGQVIGEDVMSMLEKLLLTFAEGSVPPPAHATDRFSLDDRRGRKGSPAKNPRRGK